jgi:hypothetical protein
MRIVRHPNIVELKAFYYSNGDRVCVSWVSRPIVFPSPCSRGLTVRASDVPLIER